MVAVRVVLMSPVFRCVKEPFFRGETLLVLREAVSFRWFPIGSMYGICIYP